ncbi:phosphoglycerate dehydrogenase [Floccifex sp.]|uniref:phosphoglycerate dehydrogenase n=1 Tax=Floccifex sp. TaxID=2815810 RepID=UPI003F0D91EE
MYNVKLYNNIAQEGLNQLDNKYVVNEDIEQPDAILVRSANLHDINYNPELKAIARAGAGVNNIDIDTCTTKGIAVFNTPGANSNAVKELVFAGLLLASRDIYHGMEWVKQEANNPDLSKLVEKQKKHYAGNELMGKSLGVIGCGAIGVQVANLALRFGMEVHGYDPYMSIDAAWNLSRYVQHETNIEDIYRKCDFITLHIPMNDSTKNTINKESIAHMKDGVKIINFARGGLVNDQDMKEALDFGKVGFYVTDFPSNLLASHPKVAAIPHLGASTEESEINCAVKACQEIKDYLENGNITNSVNLPNASMPFNSPVRICIIHKNIPKMISQITNCLVDNANIDNLLNKSKKDIAYTMLDLDTEISQATLDAIDNIDGVYRVLHYQK